MKLSIQLAIFENTALNEIPPLEIFYSIRLLVTHINPHQLTSCIYTCTFIHFNTYELLCFRVVSYEFPLQRYMYVIYSWKKLPMIASFMPYILYGFLSHMNGWGLTRKQTKRQTVIHKDTYTVNQSVPSTYICTHIHTYVRIHKQMCIYSM